MADSRRLRPASAVPGVGEAFATERARIQALLPDAQVTHTGGTSIPELLTRGDLDIHVRVAAADFPAAVDALANLYAAYRRQMWTDAFAAFAGPEDAEPPVGVALTAVGGAHDDRFITGWSRLRADPRLVDELNRIKSDHGGDPAAYEAAKSAFFDRLERPGQRRM